jgi:hypothetical protein
MFYFTVKYNVFVHQQNNSLCSRYMQPLYLRLVFRSNFKLIMKNLLVLLLVAFTFPVLAQETQQRNVGSFSGVKVAEGIDVYLKKGDKESVKVEVTGTKAENIITEVSGSYLKVHMASGNIRGRVQAKVYVTYVSLDKLSASSAGNIFSEDNIKADDMEIQCSSAGTIEVKLDCNSVDVSASSAGQVELQGRTKSLIADCSSAGQINAYDLEADKVEAEASSGASMKVNVLSSFSANASSGGSIRYRGNPGKSITNSSSGGSVKKSS